MSVVPSEPRTKIERSIDLSNKVATVFQTRAKLAQERVTERVQRVFREQMAGASLQPMLPWELAMSWTRYAADAVQRWVLFSDTLFLIYGNLFSTYLADRPREAGRALADPRMLKQKWSDATLARVEEILGAIGADPAPVLRLAMLGPNRAVRPGATQP